MLDEVLVEISHNCNLHCTMCVFGNSYDHLRFMTLGNYKQILSGIKGQTRAIRLNGRGESTIHPNFIQILLATRGECPSTEINLFSNFMFSNADIIRELIVCEVQLFVSIDSTDNEELAAIRRGADFATIKSNLNAVSSANNRPFIVFTIQERNINRIYDIAIFASDYNCNVLYNTISGGAMGNFIDSINQNMDHVVLQLNMADRLLRSIGRECLIPDQMAGIPIPAQSAKRTCGSMTTCDVIGQKLCIFYDGKVGPCNMLNPYVIGNIFENAPSEILNSSVISEFKSNHSSNKYCRNCANMGI